MKASRSIRSRHATTLVELIVALAILAIMLIVAGLTFRAPARHDNSVERQVAASRRLAVLKAKPVTFFVVGGADTGPAIALPDGSVIGASFAKIDRLTGRSTNARR